RGIDRHIQAMAPVVPDAYRNPGPSAPIVAVPVNNLGEADLHISALMVSGEPVWTLVNSTAFQIGGLGSANIAVTFSPTDYGKAPTGMLTIMNDPNGMPMVRVNLDGNGLNRNIDLGPDPIDFGYVGLGIPITKTDVLHVASMNSQTAFQIDHIELQGDTDAFSIDGSPAA